jgi:hypothetical protein
VFSLINISLPASDTGLIRPCFFTECFVQDKLLNIVPQTILGGQCIVPFVEMFFLLLLLCWCLNYGCGSGCTEIRTRMICTRTVSVLYFTYIYVLICMFILIYWIFSYILDLVDPKILLSVPDPRILTPELRIWIWIQEANWFIWSTTVTTLVDVTWTSFDLIGWPNLLIVIYTVDFNSSLAALETRLSWSESFLKCIVFMFVEQRRNRLPRWLLAPLQYTFNPGEW